MRFFLTLLFVFALSIPAEAQQPKKVPRIGFIVGQSRSSSQYQVDGFRQGLRDLGYIEDKKIVIDYRYGEGKEDLLTHAGIVDALVAAKSRGVHVALKTDRTESAGKTRAPNLRLHS